MLWNTIYEFYIKYIFGGFLRVGNSYIDYNAILSVTYDSSVGGKIWHTKNTIFSIFGVDFCLGNYLSLIATIITMVVILILCCALIKKIYNLCAHVIG